MFWGGEGCSHNKSVAVRQYLFKSDFAKLETTSHPHPKSEQSVPGGLGCWDVRVSGCQGVRMSW